MTEKCWVTLILTIGSAAMIYARRHNNKDSNAGYGIAGWTIFLLLCIWIDK